MKQLPAYLMRRMAFSQASARAHASRALLGRILFPHDLSKVFNALLCNTFSGEGEDEQSFLRVDFSIDCKSPMYVSSMRPYALAMVFVYPLGSFLLLAHTLQEPGIHVQEKAAAAVATSGRQGGEQLGPALWKARRCRRRARGHTTNNSKAMPRGVRLDTGRLYGELRIAARGRSLWRSNQRLCDIPGHWPCHTVWKIQQWLVRGILTVCAVREQLERRPATDITPTYGQRCFVQSWKCRHPRLHFLILKKCRRARLHFLVLKEV